MSEIITASNLDLVIQKNREIADEVSAQVNKIQADYSYMRQVSRPQLALRILHDYGLVQVPVEDNFWSGAIYVKEGKRIPALNTALPRANQYFSAWHEIYHLKYDNVSFDHMIENDHTLEERKAEYFAACILLQGVETYFEVLPAMDFVSKVLLCMSTFQAPYKAVLISLYEDAVRRNDDILKKHIKEVIDARLEDIPERFRELGLDDDLVLPSYVINVSYLQERISMSKLRNPEVEFNYDNEIFINNIIKEFHMITSVDKNDYDK